MFTGKNLFFILFVLLAISSCTTYRSITLVRNLDPSTSDSIFKKKIDTYKIQPADILYVKVSCMDESINEVFNKSILSSNLTSLNLGGFYVIGYTVEKDGTITLPVLGKVPVSGLTVQEVLSLIQKQADKYISNAQIDVRLVSFKISVLGEVRRPGQYNVFNDRASIFEALAIAGDISYYGNRKNVLILRSEPEGTRTFRVNLTDKSILASPLYFLQPNDIVYVEPMKSAGLRLSAADYSVLISTISVTLTTIILIRSIK